MKLLMVAASGLSRNRIRGAVADPRSGNPSALNSRAQRRCAARPPHGGTKTHHIIEKRAGARVPLLPVRPLEPTGQAPRPTADQHLDPSAPARHLRPLKSPGSSYAVLPASNVPPAKYVSRLSQSSACLPGGAGLWCS
jgi:hypothetical protein